MEDIIHGTTENRPVTVIGGESIELVVCINLTTRKDRELYMIKIMDEQKIPFRFFKATPHPNPVQGCKESHLAVIKYAKEHSYKNVLILEDDIEFTRSVETVPQFPKEWEMLYLGGLMRNMYDKRDINNKDWIGGLVICCQSYIVNSSVFDKIIEMNKELNKEVDILFANTIHRNGKTFMIADPLTKQIAGWSDLEKRYKWIDYKWPKTGHHYVVP